MKRMGSGQCKMWRVFLLYLYSIIAMPVRWTVPWLKNRPAFFPGVHRLVVINENLPRVFRVDLIAQSRRAGMILVVS